MAITYEALCPVHHTKITCKKEDMATVTYKDGKKEKRPVFFCASCKRFYAYSPDRKDKGIKDSNKEYKGYPFSWAYLKYSIVSDTPGMTGSIWKTDTKSVGSGAGRTFTGGKTTTSKTGKTGNVGNAGKATVKPPTNEQKIRIHVLKNSEIEDRKSVV